MRHKEELIVESEGSRNGGGDGIAAAQGDIVQGASSSIGTGHVIGQLGRRRGARVGEDERFDTGDG